MTGKMKKTKSTKFGIGSFVIFTRCGPIVQLLLIILDSPLKEKQSRKLKPK